ncbi:pilus assembly protein [Ramlibacter sp. MAHUQ-53]|uniref:pilus assembly protein n=1 Tax=unclassified Ramlibacter TaxID=2617605 RepID=UPI00363497ED
MTALPRLILAATAAALLAAAARADDIDIFLTRTSSGGVKPNVMILVDNTSNWARQAQQWPDNGGTQGAAELAAVRNVLATTTGMNIGLAGYTAAGAGGGYIRFSARDMDVPANKSAMTGILNYITAGNTINSPTEKVNAGSYETSAMYEVYKYFKGLPVFRGGLQAGNDPARNVDIDGNAGAAPNATGWRQNSALGHWAYSGSTYSPPAGSTTCTNNALILVINNAQGTIPAGDPSYEGVSAGAALPQIPGVTDPSWTDEWARFLYQNGISVYVLDAYNAQQNVSHSKTLERAAAVGGGTYHAVKNQAQIEIALGKILAEINARDSTFASAALPVSASNRSQYLNQVFIGMFRPDPAAQPRWLGNLKQYQLGLTASGDVQLRDAAGANAINPQTGFIHECAVSQWTSDSGSYWQDIKGLSIGASSCTAFPTVGGVAGSAWSDLPDGPTVAKGGVAEVVRKGNNPPGTNANPQPWAAGQRRLLTYDAGAATRLANLGTGNTGWTQSLLDWVAGRDDDTTVEGTRPFTEYISTSSSPRPRASIHGDVVHSKPLPVNYGGTTGVTVYYGAGDGLLRAVDAATGRERWAFAAPEHFGRFQRLKDNTPAVAFPGLVTSPAPQPKDYFFDGGIGLFQDAGNSRVWIYPSQRRGGRMLYGFDVTTPESPQLMWRVGCPRPAPDDTGCTAGLSALGQTWSQPTVVRLKGYPSAGAETPLVLVGGGYDTCEDANAPAPACGSRKGNAVFLLDAATGAVVRSFTGLSGSVAADIAVGDRNGDGFVDVAYAVTTTGDVYRLYFSDAGFGAIASGSWGIRRVGATAGGGRKFLNSPALLSSGTKMYVALGSGDREKPLMGHYPYANPVTNRFYVLMDDLADPTANPGVAALDDTSVMRDFSAPTTCETAGVTPGSTARGWFMDLPGRGEQTVTSAVTVGGMVTFSTNRATAGSLNTCAANANLGEARGYWLNILNGSGAIGSGNASCGGDRSGVFVQGGIVPSPTLATVQIGNVVQTVAIGAIQRSGGASSGVGPQAIKPPVKAKRRTIYWRSNQAE